MLKLLTDRLPSPAPMLRRLDRWVPWSLKCQLVEPQLNQLFGRYIREGEFDLLAERFITLRLRDLQIQLTLTLENEQLRLRQQTGEVTISGDLETFIQLARQQADADGLFFQRKLVLEGDTELGLGVRNLLDSLEWSLADSRIGTLLLQLEALRQRLPSAVRPFSPSVG